MCTTLGGGVLTDRSSEQFIDSILFATLLPQHRVATAMTDCHSGAINNHLVLVVPMRSNLSVVCCIRLLSTCWWYFTSCAMEREIVRLASRKSWLWHSSGLLYWYYYTWKPYYMFSCLQYERYHRICVRYSTLYWPCKITLKVVQSSLACGTDTTHAGFPSATTAIVRSAQTAVHSAERHPSYTQCSTQSGKFNRLYAKIWWCHVHWHSLN